MRAYRWTPYARDLLLLTLLFALSPGCHAAERDGEKPAAAETLRRDFRSLVFGGRTMAKIEPKTLLTSTAEGRRVERVQFDSEPGERVIAAVARPAKAEGRLPVVIVQHYLGGSKDELIIQGLVWQLAGRGFLAVAIDGRYRG